MIKLSIIIPVFNVEKYIEKCILSAIHQDINPDEFEIIVVDDESPDNSIRIVNKLIENHSNIRLFSQRNKGLGGARNTGIINAKGKYLLFLDADDYLYPNVIGSIIELSFKNKLDVLEFGATGLTEKGKVVYTKSKSSNNILSGYEYLHHYQYMNSACNKLYNTSFIKKNKLFFKEQIFIEDFEFNTRVFYYAKKVKATSNIVSNYVQTLGSITRNNNKKKHKKMLGDIEKVIYLTTDFKENIPAENNLQHNVINERISFLVVTLLYNVLKFRCEYKYMEELIKRLIKNKLYPAKTKIHDRKKNTFRLLINSEYRLNIIYKLFKYSKTH